MGKHVVEIAVVVRNEEGRPYNRKLQVSVQASSVKEACEIVSSHLSDMIREPDDFDVLKDMTPGTYSIP